MSRKKFRNAIARMLRHEGKLPFGLAAKLARWIASPLDERAEVSPKLLLHLGTDRDIASVRAAVEAAAAKRGVTGTLHASYDACCDDPSHGEALRGVTIVFGNHRLASH